MTGTMSRASRAPRASVTAVGVVGGLALALTSCGAAAGGPTEHPTATRYRVGDRIVYRYAGEALDDTVVLEERILAVDGLRLRIEVTARRAGEVRRWLQVVTDTEEDRASNHVDALYEVDAAGAEHLLANEDGEDLRELYEWTLPDVEWGEPGEEHVTIATRSFAGRDWSCRIATTPLPAVGDDARIELSDCDALVWTHGPGTLTSAGRTLWSVEVVEVGEPVPSAP